MENGSIAIETKFDTIHHAFSKYCADLRPITHVFNQIESFHMPLLVMLPEDIQSMLVHSTNIGGLSLLSIILLVFMLTALFLVLSTIILKVDKSRKASNVSLNQAIINLELKIKSLSFDKETFRTKIVELESELEAGKGIIIELEAQQIINLENSTTINELKKRLADTEAQTEKLNQEKVEQSAKLELSSKKFGDIETKMRTIEEKKQLYETQIEELEIEASANEEEIDRLGKEIELKDKSIEHLQMCISSQSSRIATIDENLTNGNNESLVEASRNDFMQVKGAYEESLVKIKELELKLKLMDDLRKKDLELNVKACSELDAQLKKKSSDAEKAQHLYEQLRVKQERIGDLESQVTRLEKKATQERQQFEKQAHENWLSARKYEKEAKEAKQEARSWKDKFGEIEKFKTNSLIRPVAVVQPVDEANQSLNVNEERNERPASVASHPLFIAGQFMAHGVSPTPLVSFMNPLAPLTGMFPRPPFPPMPFPMCSPFGDNRNNTPSPEVISMMSRYPPMMSIPPSSLVSPLMNLYSNSTNSLPNLSQISPFQANNDYLLNSQSLNFDDSMNNTSNMNQYDANPSNSTTSMV